MRIDTFAGSVPRNAFGAVPQKYSRSAANKVFGKPLRTGPRKHTVRLALRRKCGKLPEIQPSPRRRNKLRGFAVIGNYRFGGVFPVRGYARRFGGGLKSIRSPSDAPNS